jgi:hypothetical protein
MNFCQIFLKFKTFGMKFGHLEQKLELSNQNMCKKFLKNNAHMRQTDEKNIFFGLEFLKKKCKISNFSFFWVEALLSTQNFKKS